MTDFRDLVTKAWAHAKCPDAPLYLAGYDPYADGRPSAVLSHEPTPYTEEFIARAEELTGCTFERIPVDDAMALRLEYAHWLAAYARVESKNYWSDADRRWWATLGMRVADLRKAIQQQQRIEDEREEALAAGQFGVGA